MRDPIKTVLTFDVPGVHVTSITLDAMLSAGHSGDVEITEHPLETGSNIADGARAKQPSLQLEGMLADFPLGGDELGSDGRAKDLYAALRKVKDAGGVIRITTGLDSYDNMLIKQLSAPEDAKMGGAVKFSMQLTQVQLVRSQSVALKKVSTVKAQPHQKGGAESATPATPQQVSRSDWKASTQSGGLLSPFVLGGGG